MPSKIVAFKTYFGQARFHLVKLLKFENNLSKMFGSAGQHFVKLENIIILMLYCQTGIIKDIMEESNHGQFASSDQTYLE
jgi:hypothetical protein